MDVLSDKAVRTGLASTWPLNHPLAQMSATGRSALSTMSADGKMNSTLHPPTSPVFSYSNKRQAYGSVDPASLPPVRHQPARHHFEYEEECRKRWYESYAVNAAYRSASAQRSRGLTSARPDLGAGGGLKSTELTPSNWSWQPWRGWTSASRHNHEQRQRQAWLDEARQTWRNGMPDKDWRPSSIHAEMASLAMGKAA
mmetsp:Transcript_81450/g.141426  ORF Transcript_81450/g.141426 Transcript_81450/m.141426 type:complete len:198 (+) Transcript_81450:63-656(+)